MKTYALKVVYFAEGCTIHRQRGRNQTWWNVVASLTREVYGQMIYLATPI